ncbi:MAG: DedA family protein [Rhizomicrobium sp.]
MHGLFAWIGDAADWLLTFAKNHPDSAFAIAFVVSFAESFAGLSFLVPGTTILIALGALLRAIDAAFLSYFPVWAAAAVGAILGDWISYWIGHRFKEHVLSTWPITHYRDQMDTALRFFGRWGVWGIFIGRFMGPFRATVPLVAGISQMRFWPFQIANVSSALIWSASLLLLGAAGWAAMKSIWHSLGGWPTIAVAVIVIALGIAFHGRIAAAWRSLAAKRKGETA